MAHPDSGQPPSLRVCSNDPGSRRRGRATRLTDGDLTPEGLLRPHDDAGLNDAVSGQFGRGHDDAQDRRCMARRGGVLAASEVRPLDRFSEGLDRRIGEHGLAQVARHGFDVVPSRATVGLLPVARPGSVSMCNLPRGWPSSCIASTVEDSSMPARTKPPPSGSCNGVCMALNSAGQTGMCSRFSRGFSSAHTTTRYSRWRDAARPSGRRAAAAAPDRTTPAPATDTGSVSRRPVRGRPSGFCGPWRTPRRPSCSAAGTVWPRAPACSVPIAPAPARTPAAGG